MGYFTNKYTTSYAFCPKFEAMMYLSLTTYLVSLFHEQESDELLG